jgi:hypothetical protein
MEKRTSHRLDCRLHFPYYFFMHRLDRQIPFPLMTEKEDSFINLHSTFSHDTKASPSLRMSRR